MVSKFTVAAIAMSAMFLGGCFVDEESQGNVAHPDPANPGDPVDPAPPGAVNNAPKISGTPGTVVLQDEFYEFLPQASDADGDALEFSISRKPAWAKFDPTSGLDDHPAPGRKELVAEKDEPSARCVRCPVRADNRSNARRAHLDLEQDRTQGSGPGQAR